MTTNYSSECDCGDYCEYCHPEMCGVPSMTHDLYDRLLEYIENQKNQIKKDMLKNDANREYQRGRLTAFLDLLSFLMTDGKLL